MGYLANFMVYTLAMVGIISIALLVFKNSGSFGGSMKSKHLKVMDTLTLGPRKHLYIITTGQEKFLIAGDVDKTTLISKLETTDSVNIVPPKTEEVINYTTQSFEETMSALPKSKYMDRQNLGIKSSLMSQKGETPYTSVIRNLAEKIRN